MNMGINKNITFTIFIDQISVVKFCVDNRYLVAMSKIYLSFHGKLQEKKSRNLINGLVMTAQ